MRWERTPPTGAVALRMSLRRGRVGSTDVGAGSGDEKPCDERTVHGLDLADKAHIGAGRTGVVFAATFQHRRVAVKVAVGMPYLRPLWTVVDRERMQYRQLEHLQGRCIPRILGGLP